MHAVVIGAGPVGATVTEQLAAAGHTVRVLTRSGSGPVLPGVELLACDASDVTALTAAGRGADAFFHCLHTAYDVRAWERDLPAADSAVLSAAGDRVVVFPEGLYAYDADGVMDERTPRTATSGKRGVRARLLAARAASSTPTASVVASDFLGPRALTAHAGERMLGPVLAGGTVRVIGSADQPHSFTYVPDLAAAMIEAAGRPELWDTVLHAPTGPAVTQRDLVEGLGQAAGTSPSVGTIPGAVLRALGLVHRSSRELAEVLYQFERPFVMSSVRSEGLLGLTPTPFAEQLAATVAWFRGARLEVGSRG